jgi:3,4-dihydroxy 2-butanone 4-phosphate synthase/GTP cyclohydrolase II
MRVFADETHGAEHIALSKGDLSGDEPVLVRMHALNPLGDVLGINRTSSDLENAMRVIGEAGRGVVVLLRDTTMKLVEEGEVSPQTLRQYGLGAQILAALGLSDLILLTNSGTPRIVGLEAYGLSIEGTHPIPKES